MNLTHPLEKVESQETYWCLFPRVILTLISSDNISFASMIIYVFSAFFFHISISSGIF